MSDVRLELEKALGILKSCQASSKPITTQASVLSQTAAISVANSSSVFGGTKSGGQAATKQGVSDTGIDSVRKNVSDVRLELEKALRILKSCQASSKPITTQASVLPQTAAISVANSSSVFGQTQPDGRTAIEEWVSKTLTDGAIAGLKKRSLQAQNQDGHENTAEDEKQEAVSALSVVRASVEASGEQSVVAGAELSALNLITASLQSQEKLSIRGSTSGAPRTQAQVLEENTKLKIEQALLKPTMNSMLLSVGMEPKGF